MWQFRRRTRIAHLLKALTVAFITTILQLPTTDGQTCSRQPFISAADPPSASRLEEFAVIGGNLNVSGTTNVTWIVSGDDILSRADLRVTGSRITFRVDIPTTPSVDALATFALYPNETGCEPVSVDIFIVFRAIFVLVEADQIVQPGSVITTQNACLPPDCGDNSTSYDIILLGQTLESLSATSLGFTVRVPPIMNTSNADSDDAELMIQTLYSLLGSSARVSIRQTPPITSVTPSSGQRGTRVIIRGSNLLALQEGLMVEYSRVVVGSNETDFEPRPRSNSTHIYARVASGRPGSTTVSINTTQTVSGTHYDGPYTFSFSLWTQLEDGIVTEIIPPSAQINSTITLCGERLLGGGVNISSITIAGQQVQSSGCVVLFNNSLECIDISVPSVPRPADISPGGVRIESNTGAVVESTANVSFTYATITNVTPSEGQIGTEVTIIGIGLLSGYPSLTPTVYLAGVRATLVNSSSQRITVRVNSPEDTQLIGSGSTQALRSNDTVITVTRNGTNFTVSLENSWRYLEPGNIETVDPGNGQYGTRITLTGSNLFGYGSSLRRVTVNSSLAEIVSESNTEVVITAPDISRLGLVEIVLESSNGALVSVNDAFEYRERGMISNLTPSSGQNGTFVVIEGSNLFGHADSITNVTFGGVLAEIDDDNTNTSHVRVRVGPNDVAMDTAVSVVITAVSMARVVSGGNDWTYLVPGMVQDVQPDIGQNGTIVTITGTNLLGGGANVQTILLDGVPVTTVNEATPTLINVSMSDLSNQMEFYRGTIYILANTGAVVVGGAYTHRPSGIITGFSPMTGQEGTQIVINGTNLPGYGNRVMDVQIAGISGKIVDQISESEVVVRAGPAASGTMGSITLTSDTGAIVTSQSNLVFTYTERGNISNVVPSQGAEGSGVEISGSFLRPPGTSIISVTIGGSPVLRIVTQSETELSVIAGPAPLNGATNADIEITASDGAIVRGGNFTYLNLTLSLPDLNRGQQGTRVTLNLPDDEAFNPSLPIVAKIGGASAEIMSTSSTPSIEVVVPRAAEVGSYSVDVSVEGVDGRVARLRNGFTYAEEGVITSVNPSGGQLGTIVDVMGRNLLGGGNFIQLARIGQRGGGREVGANVTVSDNDTVRLQIRENLPVETTFPVRADITLVADTGATIIGIGLFVLFEPSEITNVAPTRGQFGTRVSITGTNLLEGLTTEHITSITLSGVEVHEIMNTSTDSEIIVRAGSSSETSLGSVIITLDSGARIITPDTITFEYLQPGVIDSVAPPIGTVGTRVTISGENLLVGGTVDEVRLGGQQAQVEGNPTNSVILVTARAPMVGASGNGTVEIFVDTGAVISGEEWQFEELGVIETVSPLVGQQGVAVVIRGSSLLGSSAGSFSGCSLAGIAGTVTLSTETEAQCVAGFNPFSTNNSNPDQLSGPVVLIADSGPLLVSSDNFTYYVARIDQLDPVNGTNGTFVNISGTNLVGSGDTVDSVTFGDIETLSVDVLSQDSIRVRVDASPTARSGQTVRINLTSGIFLELDSSWGYIEQGEITALSPSSARPGEMVTISGNTLLPLRVSTKKVIVIVGQTRSYKAEVINSSTVTFRPGPYQETVGSSDNLDDPGVPLPVQVIASNGATVYNSNTLFTYSESTARVTSVTPMVGSGGTTVTIIGTNLLYNSTVVAVSLAGINATVTRASDTELVVMAGDGPANGGRGRLIIETTSGLVSGIGTNVWEYLPVITADDVTPQSGQNGTRVSIDLKGISLTSTGFFLAGVEARLRGGSGDVITVEAGPSPQTPLGDVRINFDDEGISITIPSSWQYLEPPRVDSLTPSSGYYNTSVTISGDSLRAGGRLIDSVSLAGISTEILSQTDGEIVVRVSEFRNSSNGAISGGVTIIWTDGAVHTDTSLEFIYVQLVVSDVSPNLGQGGTRVVITGIGLLAGSPANQPIQQIQIGGVEVQNITEISDTRISLIAPASENGIANGNITYVVSEGGSVLIENSWSYLEPGVVVEVSPLNGVQGSYVTIRGERLLQGGEEVSRVRIAGVEVFDIVAGYNDLIQVRLGLTPLLPQGEIIITSNTGATLTNTFITFQYRPSGVITAVSPDSGQNGTRVVISGSGFSEFGEVVVVTLAGVVVNIMERVSNTSIIVEAGRPDLFGEFSGDVTIETDLGVIITGNQTFTYNREGVVYFGSPSQGREGTRTIISGERLTGGGSRVQRAFLAGIEASDVTTLNDSSILVTAGNPMTPDNSTGDIVLASDSGAYVRQIDGWSYVIEGEVTTVVPEQGQYGTRVNISGTGLLSGGDSVTEVMVGNVSSSDVIFSSETRVEVRMAQPTGRDNFTAPLTLISNYGGELRSSMEWTYLQPSRNISHSPVTGMGGDTVTIEGERLLGGGSRIVSVTTAEVPASSINSSNNSIVIFTVGFEPNGADISGDIVMESDTGALTVIENGWSFERTCRIGQFGTFSNCTDCNDQCISCNGPSSDDCLECENFELPLSGVTNRCVERCPNVSTLDNVCMDACGLNQYGRVDSERSVVFCYNCNDQCDDRLGCSGPESTECRGCRAVLDQLSQSCVEACTPGTWQNPQNECLPCHSQCNTSAGCFGPANSDCYECINVQISSTYINVEGSGSSSISDVCIESCPGGFYEESDRRTCLPCNEQCLGGCDGASPFNCFQCASVSRLQDNAQQYCVPSCNDGLNQRTLFESRNRTCGQCSSLCSLEDGCTGPTPSDCITCRFNSTTNTSLPRFNGECIGQCPNSSVNSEMPAPGQFYYHNLQTGNCEFCDISCKNGCTGPGPNDCRGLEGDKENLFSAGRGTIIITVIVTALLAIALALVLTAILITLLRRRQRYKLDNFLGGGGGGGGGVEMSMKYSRPYDSTRANDQLKESATESADDEYLAMEPTQSIAPTLKRDSLQREQSEAQLKGQNPQSTVRASMIDEADNTEVTMIENIDAVYVEAGAELPDVPPRPTKPAPFKPATSPDVKPPDAKPKQKGRKSAEDHRKSMPPAAAVVVAVNPSLNKSVSSASIPERKPAAPLPPAESEGEMYTEMSVSIHEFSVGPEEEYSAMSPVHEGVEELLYEDTAGSPPVSPQKSSSDTAPLIESLYEDTEDTVSSPDYHKVKHTASTASLPVQPTANSTSAGPKPFPRSRSATPLPQTPLEASLQGKKPPPVLKPAPIVEDLYEETEAGRPDEECLYEAIGQQGRPLPDEPSPEMPTKERGRKGSINPPLPPKGRK